MTDCSIVPVRRALLSVSDKTALTDLACGLDALGIELISTGGTAQHLRDAGLRVTDVAQVTQFPEIMDGRLKTLHPNIHGALLGRQGKDEAVMVEHGIAPIDLVVVNLYPFEAATALPDCTLDHAIETIDIGGPAMLRAAAKNSERVTAVVDPADYAELIETLHQQQGTPLLLRRRLAAKVFAHTARYDGLIANYLGARITSDHAEPFPASLHLSLNRHSVLRYGENPHQNAALYLEHHAPSGVVATAQILAGKELSFNNLADADAALECVKAFRKTPACVIVKHGNPCGVALGTNALEAYEYAYATDPTSAFGGIIAFNQPLEGATAEAILARQFVEVVIAPEVTAAALAAFSKKPNVRVLACGPWPEQAQLTLDFRRIAAAVLIQDADRDTLLLKDLKVVSKLIPNVTELRDLLFAWHVAMFVKSNAIVYARDSRTIGIGAGQTSRVLSAKIAGLKAEEAGLSVIGAVMASDAFLPFRDGIDAAAALGIRAVIQPGGSMRDDEIIAAADAYEMAMVFTGVRHFRH